MGYFKYLPDIKLLFRPFRVNIYVFLKSFYRIYCYSLCGKTFYDLMIGLLTLSLFFLLDPIILMYIIL